MERQKLRSQDLFTIDIWMLSASQLDPGFELSRSEPDRREPDRSRIGVGSELARSWIGAHVNRAGRRFEDR